MAWVKFTDTFWYRATPQVKTRYKADTTSNVPSACADAAVKAGKAVRMRKASKSTRPVEADDAEA